MRRYLLLALVCLAALFLFWPRHPDPGSQEVTVEEPSQAGAEVLCLVNDCLKPGESLYDLLLRHGVSPRFTLEVGAALADVLPPGNLRPQDRMKLWWDYEGRLVRLGVDRGPLQRYRVEVTGDGLLATQVAVPVDTVMHSVRGRLDDNLWNSFVTAGASPAVVVSFTEVFAWSVDFFRDAQPGDAFGVLFPELCVDGTAVGTGEIEAAFYVRGEDTLWAIGFAPAGRTNYYDEEGRSLKKALLRAPLKYSHVSSGFSRRRLHPLHRVYRSHNGIDYAASPGTPVYAAGDGEVRHAGWRGGLGKCVEIRHPNGYRTMYGHLRSIARGVRPGVPVEQRQLIGYVGATGDATGPHLHYEVRLGAKPVNPRTLKLPAQGPVDDSLRAAFSHRCDSLRRILVPVYGPLLARAE